jgi:hypothetical protein
MPGWARKIPPDWAPSGDAPWRRWLVPSFTEPGSAWPPNGHLRWPWACATSRCACCPSSFARSLAAVLDRTAHERPAGSGNPLTIASNESGLHPVRPRRSPRVAAAAQLCACLARKARRPGEGRRSSPFVSFREGSKIGIGDHLGQLAALIMAVIGRGDGIFRPRGSRFGDGAAAGRPSCGQRHSDRGGSASPGWLPAGIDWSLATPRWSRSAPASASFPSEAPPQTIEVGCSADVIVRVGSSSQP